VKGDFHAGICGSRGLRCPRPPDLKTVVVSDTEKAHSIASGGDQEDGAQSRCLGSLLTCRYWN